MTYQMTAVYEIGPGNLFRIISGLGKPDKAISSKTPRKSKLSDQDKEDLEIGFKNLYWGLTWMSWMHEGVKLGTAWKIAFEQSEGIIKNFLKQFGQNPAIDYLQEYITTDKVNSKNDNSRANLLMEVPKDETVRYEQNGIRLVNSGIKELSDKITAFNMRNVVRHNNTRQLQR